MASNKQNLFPLKPLSYKVKKKNVYFNEKVEQCRGDFRL